MRSLPSTVSSSSRNISRLAPMSAKISEGSQLGPRSLRARFDWLEVDAADATGAGLATPTVGAPRPIGLGGQKPGMSTEPASTKDLKHLPSSGNAVGRMGAVDRFGTLKTWGSILLSMPSSKAPAQTRSQVQDLRTESVPRCAT